MFEGGIAALNHYCPRCYPGKVDFLVCGYHTYPPEAPRAVWGRLVEQPEVQSVPAEHAFTASVHAEYVANWLFDRVQEAIGQDLGPPDAEPMTNGLDAAPEPVHSSSF
ncbi:MAG TPA: hypothetical protein VHX39_35770 [Acetobacteraceae bacterium]|nr:hypothetical protein [Acetobacteraceae bacterium]